MHLHMKHYKSKCQVPVSFVVHLNMYYFCDIYCIKKAVQISLWLPRLLKLPGPFEKHWLDNMSNLGRNIMRIQP